MKSRNPLELGKQFAGLTFEEVGKIAASGNQDAADFLEADKKFNHDMGYLISIGFAECDDLKSLDSPRITRYIKYFYSRRMLIYRDRWYNADGNPNYTIENLYNQRKFIFYFVNEQMGVFYPTKNLFYFYTRLFPPALFLALCDAEHIRNVIVGMDIAQRLTSPVRVEIERDLLGGITTDQKEDFDNYRNLRSYADEPDYVDDEEYEVCLSGGDRELSGATLEATIYYSMVKINQPGERKYTDNTQKRAGMHFSQSRAIDWYNEEHDPRIDAIIEAITDFSKLDQYLILHTWHYGELRYLSQKTGIRESTLQSRKSRLIAKLRQKLNNCIT